MRTSDRLRLDVGVEGLEALALGGLAQSSLILAGLAVYLVRPSAKVIAGLAGFGAGALIAAVAFELIPEGEGLDNWELGRWLLIGAAIFVVSDRIVESRFGEGDDAGPLGIVVGSVVDGVPESIIFGIQIATRQVISAAFIAAVWVSNVPQALAPSAALAESGWKVGKRAGMGVWWCWRVPSRLGSVISWESDWVPPATVRRRLRLEACWRCSPTR